MRDKTEGSPAARVPLTDAELDGLEDDACRLDTWVIDSDDILSVIAEVRACRVLSAYLETAEARARFYQSSAAPAELQSLKAWRREAEGLLREALPWFDVLAKQWDHGGKTWRELTSMRNRADLLLGEGEGNAPKAPY